jgi:hypothetical protein
VNYPCMARKKDEAVGKRWPLSIRTTKELKEALEKAAKRSGRSLAQEVERRLEFSVFQDRSRTMVLAVGHRYAPIIIHKGELLVCPTPVLTIPLTIHPSDLKRLLAYFVYAPDKKE